VDIKILKIFQDTCCKDIKDVPNNFGDLEYQSEALKPSNTDRRQQLFQCVFASELVIVKVNPAGLLISNSGTWNSKFI